MAIKRPHSNNRKNQKAYTLIELLVSLLIGIIVSFAAVLAFMSHSHAIYKQMTYNQAGEDVSEAYALLSRLLQQAEGDNITISGVSSTGNCTHAITIDISIPAGYPIWPNTVSPYDKNRVRIALSDVGDNPHSITIAKAVEDGLDTATVTPFAGSDSGENTKITCMSLVRQNDSTYAFSVAGYARNFDAGDIAYEGVVLPRN